jgi:hypothetical protein
VSGRHVIVWDLDNTLGDFSALHGQGESSQPVQVRLRPGLEPLLHSLAAAGFQHTLLTLATPLYAEAVLRGTGLRHFFVRVEGLGMRGKGDAAGIGEALGIPEGQRPHRMLFVGDHPLFDEPRDPRVVFHLEPCALIRPAADLGRLVLHLREAGGGSLRQGFERVCSARSGWRALWPFGRDGDGTPVRRTVPGVGSLVMVRRREGCPVIGFATLPEPAGAPGEFEFVPAHHMAQAQLPLHGADPPVPAPQKEA